MILLDTVVLSEIRKSRPSPKLMAWLKAQREDQLFLSVISLGEIARGIEGPSVSTVPPTKVKSN